MNFVSRFWCFEGFCARTRSRRPRASFLCVKCEEKLSFFLCVCVVGGASCGCWS